MLSRRFHACIPGGCHTYAKGDDQYPESMPIIIDRGEGCHVWDVDGNRYIEYGMGLRAVTLGHAFEPVLEAVRRELMRGSNFARPASIEIDCAESLLEIIEGAEQVKFTKDGSSATTAALKLARAYTGRDMVAICSDHPFYSYDDWFIGNTAMSAGIPNAIKDLTVTFRYNDLESLDAVFDQNPGRISSVMLEPARLEDPENNFLHEARDLCRKHGSMFIFDEMITGFRWHLGGGQRYYGVVPDLSTFGKGMANGFSVSALIGKREFMEPGGLTSDGERVFLLSTTHGAETHSLAAALATMEYYKAHPVIEFLWEQGRRLKKDLDEIIEELNLHSFFAIIGKPCNLVYATRDQEGLPSQSFRTLFLQEIIKGGIIAPSLVVSFSHTDEVIEQTVDVMGDALYIYKKALDEGIETYLEGRPVKPVIRQYN